MSKKGGNLFRVGRMWRHYSTSKEGPQEESKNFVEMEVNTYMMDDKCLIDPQRDCLGLQKANMLERQMEKMQEQARDTHNKLFDRIRDLEKAEAARNEQYENIMGKLDKLIAWQEAEQAAPKKRWDSIKDKAIWAVLAAVIAFLLGRIGL